MAQATVLRRLQRIREMEERQRRVDLVVAQQAEAQRERALAGLGQRVQSSYDSAQDDVMSLQAHHRNALSLEMHRRAQAQDLERRQAERTRRQQVLQEAARAARTIERVADRRQEAWQKEQGKKAQRRLDEIGMSGWWRRAQGGQ